MGDDPREIPTPSAGRNGDRLNSGNYRIRENDGIGRGPLKHKCLHNFAAIELLQRLEAENRAASDAEKSVLVRYVGWGGLPQVFAWHESPEWQEERERLRNLLSPEEYAAARASTLNAHYTAPGIIRGIYEAVEHLGFSDGRILEPALGIGHFFGLMPESMAARSQLTGIELDSLSARIARKLYPDADIRNQGFEKTNLPNEFFDLAISNIPFGDYRLFDPDFDAQRFLVHDYFFAKGLEKVRPGGLLVFITSKGTMDKVNANVREYLHERAELLGAVRLPNSAFKENANTEVTTDILFLKKLAGGEANRGPAWVQLAEHISPDSTSFQINEYFAARPHMMLGTMAEAGRLYRGNEAALIPDARNLNVALSMAVKNLPKAVYQATTESVTLAASPQTLRPPDGTKENAFVLHDGNIYIRTGSELTLIPNLPLETTKRIRGLIKLREALQETLRTQLEDAHPDQVLEARRLLNQHYDYFVSRFRPINERANRRAFRGDPDLPLLCSLEDYNDETRKAQKTAIFSERTIQKPQIAAGAETAKDALVLTLNETGRVDLERIGYLLRKGPEDFLPELQGLIYRNPASGEWETEDQYLSGDVRSKLAVAITAAETDPAYAGNIEALRAVQPADLDPSEIDARLGAAWLPASDIQAFANEVLGSEGIRIEHSPVVATWFVRADYSARFSVGNTTEWGTERYSAIELIQDALNLKTPTVHDYDPQTDSSTVNAQETEAARDKLEKIKDRFKAWIWENDERRERLAHQYNDAFNSVRLRVFNGSHLTLPASNPQIQLRPHQKDAVWRIVQNDNTLLAHVVGAGKTYTMVAAAMELKRLGLASKPMIVVPNHMLGQFSYEFLSLYPTANILVAGKDDFEASRRARLFSRIATGNWDAVVVTHASFEKIPLAAETRQTFIQDQIDEIKEAVREQKAQQGTRIVKELERVQRRLEVKLQALSADSKKDNTLTFEQLGIDRLFVDEAHKFKNLFYVTKMSRVAGLPQTASERAFDLFLKVQHVQRRNQGGGVVFATGTPISNTMAEMFTMQRYLQMPALRRNNLHQFDSWAGTFGETVTAMELSPDGGGYRLKTRFARFVNVPELMQMFRQVADVQTAEMLKLPVPKLEMGGPITISAPCSPELKRFVDSLVQRTEHIKNGRIDPRIDNMLKITTEGRKAALDLRLVLPGIRDHADSKTNQAVERIEQIWRESEPTRSAQLVFCDMSTPQNDGRSFSVYDDMRAKLLERGIPESQIAFIQDHDNDASKDALFKAVRDGKVRILFGSTAKMGEGTNVQKRLVALHHLDAPWRPSDIEQRDGRILRQGNDHEFVKVFRYVTEGSFDAYMWQTLETKCRFIAQVMNGDATVRRAEDVDAAALTYAEVKAIASGNPLVIEKAQIDAEVMRLTRLKNQHAESGYQMRYRIKNLANAIDTTEREIVNHREDIAARVSTRGDAFSMTLKRETFTDRIKAGRALIFLAAELKPFQSNQHIGTIGGFSISLHRYEDRITAVLHGRSEYKANVSDSPQGTIASLEHAIESIEVRLQEREQDLERHHKQIEELTRQLNQPFEHQEKLTTASKRQQEIVEALDITKNQASAKLESDPEMETQSNDNQQKHDKQIQHRSTTTA